MSHQVRDVSPLNVNSNLNSRQNKTSVTGQHPHAVTHGRVGNLGGPASGYVPYEPKKREMTQKIPPKMPMPMSQDLTNLPLPHNHVGDKQANQSGKLTQQMAGGNSKMLERPKGSTLGHGGVGLSHHPPGH